MQFFKILILIGNILILAISKYFCNIPYYIDLYPWTKERPTPAIHKVVPGLSNSFSNPPTPRPPKNSIQTESIREPGSASKSQKVSKTSDLDEQLRQHLQNLRKKDENRKREIEQPDVPKPPVFIRQTSTYPSAESSDNWTEPTRTIPIGPIGPPSKKDAAPTTPIPPSMPPIAFLPPTPPYETKGQVPDEPSEQSSSRLPSRRLVFDVTPQVPDDTVNPPPGLPPMISSIESPPNHTSIHSPIGTRPPQLESPIAPPNPIGPPSSFKDSSFNKVKPVQKVIPTVQNPTPSTSYQSNIVSNI